jgi:hypothetical protein
MLTRRADQKAWTTIKEMKPDEEGFARMEEFLFWIALLNR